MDLSLSEEQTLMQNSIQKFIKDNYDLSTRRELCASEEGFSRENWKLFAELGWLAIPFSEEDGGFGGSPADTMILMEEFGKGLVVEPYLATVVMVGTALAMAGTQEQKADILSGIIEGNILATFAYAEEQAHHELSNVITSAKKDGDFYLINGTKSVVLNAQSANKILLSARTSGGDRDTDGITLFLADADAQGISRQDYPTVDGLRASEVTFKDVRVSADDILGERDEGHKLVEKISDHAILALSAEAVGAMEVLYTDTIAYTKQREQFGHPLSDFQVLKHRMTEMFMEHSLSKSLCMKATMLECQGSAEAKRVIHALKALIGKSSRFISQNAVQLHGGMGMTEELSIAHYFKRLAVIDSQFGNVDHHLTKFIDM
jgi:alkylation response protein AidB-like acyl-CoA dehydrogenase